MLAIAQSQHRFHFLQWVPASNGPLINGYGTIEDPDFQIHKPSSIVQLIRRINSEVPIEHPVFTFSLDIENLLITEAAGADEVDPEEFLEWHGQLMQDDDFRMRYRSYHYSLAVTPRRFLSLHMPRGIIDSFSAAMQELQCELRVLGLGIFSAEECARLCPRAGEHSSYLIWRMGHSGNDQILHCEDGELRAYLHLYRHGSKIELTEVFGDVALGEKIRAELTQYFTGDLQKFSSASHVFAYQCREKDVDLKRLLEAAIPNVSLLNPLKQVTLETPSRINYLRSSCLAETGLAFRGVDV